MFLGKKPTTSAAPAKKARGPGEDRGSAVGGSSTFWSESPAPAGDRATPNLSRSWGSEEGPDPRLRHGYNLLVSLHRGVLSIGGPMGLYALCLSLWETDISDKTVLESNPNLCMHLLNEILPPRDRRDVLSELNDVEVVMRTYFERLALVNFLSLLLYSIPSLFTAVLLTP